MNYYFECVLITMLIWIFISIIQTIILSFFYYGEFKILGYNFWIGIYYDRKKRIICLNPVPCIVFSFDRNKRKKSKKKE